MSLLQEAGNKIMAPMRARQERKQLKEADLKMLKGDLGRIGPMIGDTFHRYVEILTDGEYPHIPRVELAARAMHLLILQKGGDFYRQDRGTSKLIGSFDEPFDKAASLLNDQLNEDLRRNGDPVRLLNKYSYPSLVGMRSNLGRRLASAGY